MVQDDWIEEPERASAKVAATATRDGTQMRMEWIFRRRYDIEKCATGAEGQPGTAVVIEGGDASRLALVLDGAELFRERADDEAPLRFDALAAADADADAEITLEELDA